MGQRAVKPVVESPPVVFSASGVEVVRLPLTADREEMSRLASTLAADERERAGRFHCERDRHRFTIGRGRLRQLLGAQLDVAAADVGFDYGVYGKPFIKGGASLRFNLSHTGDLMLVATSWSSDVGVDVERVRPLSHLEGLARHVCRPEELARLAQSTPTDRQNLFLRLWTCKEAWLKARGTGLFEALDGVQIELSDPGRGAVCAIGGEGDGGGWLHELMPAPHHVGAVAAI
jgi:4'-phosphopantetheinyl transferase